MHRRKLRHHRLDRRARVDERLQRQPVRLGIGVDLLREQTVARTADDRAAVAAGMRLHQSLRFENTQRLAYRAAAELRVGSKLAFGRQHDRPARIARAECADATVRANISDDLGSGTVRTLATKRSTLQPTQVVRRSKPW